MHLSLRQVKRIEAICGTPFYVFDVETFRQNYFDLRSAFVRLHPQTVLAYSFKTNYLPLACKIIQELGGYAEVVSSLEYSLALKFSYDPARIILNGPVKQYDTVHSALASRSLVNLDAAYELEYIDRYVSTTDDRDVKLGLRVNINLPSKGNTSKADLPSSRFGFPLEGLDEAVRFLDDRGIRIRSLHGHCSSDRSLETFQTITETLCRIRDEYGLDEIKYVDIGGGFFGKIEAAFLPYTIPTFADYAECVVATLQKNIWMKANKPVLILEPGISIVANTMTFVTKVLEVKQLQTRQFAIVDGSALHVKPTMHGHNLPFKHIASAEGTSLSREHAYDVVGSTCMERDVLLKDVAIRDLLRGDYLQIDNAGAYTVVLSPPFINPAPPIVAIDAGAISMVRRGQNLDDFLCCYIV